MAAAFFYLVLLIGAGVVILFCMPRRIARRILYTISLFGIGVLLAILVQFLIFEHLRFPAWVFCFLMLVALTFLLVWGLNRVFVTAPAGVLGNERLPLLNVRTLSGFHLIFASIVLGLVFLGTLVEAEGRSLSDAAGFLMFFLFGGTITLFVWGIIRVQGAAGRSDMRAACPPVERLKDLLSERLQPGEQIRLAAHLELCSVCQRRLEGLSAGQKSWPGLAKKLSERPPSPEPALQKVMHRLMDNKNEATRDEPAFAGDLPLGFLSPSDKPGQLGRLERYEVLEEIGRGGMGVVLKAFDPSLHRVVAIKVLAPQLATSGVARKRFLREARAAAAVTHDHIVTIHAVDEANGLPYLVMHYVAGQSLQQRIDKDGPLELADILRIGVQTASGLAAAHAHGIVHRDIKPANILLEEGVQRVKITDFGLARAMDDASLTQSGFVAGSPLYMAPEQTRGESLDHRADLFSLGSVLYTMCTGRPPFRAANTLAVLRRVSEDPPRPIRETNPEIPDWLADIVAKLMAKNPAERFQSAAEVEEALGRHLAQLQNGSWVPPPRSPAPNAAAELPTSVTICPSCGASLHVPERMVGSIVHCGECGKPFHVEEGSEVIQVARAVQPPLGPRPRVQRSIPRWIWITAGCVASFLVFLFLLSLFRSLRSQAVVPATAKPAASTMPKPPSATGKAIQTSSQIGDRVILSEHTVTPPELPWKQTLSWLPGEASLFGSIVFKPFGSLTLDDPFTQVFLRLFVSGGSADRFTTENLGRIHIDAVSFAYYEETKTEKARTLVHLEGLALDGRKRIIDFMRRDYANKVQVEEKQIGTVTGKSVRVSGPEMPFTVGIYDDQHIFLASALDPDAKQAEHVKALEHLPWFVFPKGGRTSPDVLSGYNPPWIQMALSQIPAEDCAVFMGEIPAGGRKLLAEALKLRRCPRSFVFHMRREREELIVSLSLNVDKAGGELLLQEDLEKWRLQGLEVLTARFPAVKQEKQALALLGQTLKTMRWGVNSESKWVGTSVRIPAPTWKAMGAILKQISQALQQERKQG